MQPLYIIEHQGLRSRYFLETDRDSNSRKAAIELIRTGEAKPVKVLEIDEDAGTVRDVTDEFLHCAKWGDHEEPFDHSAARADHIVSLRREA